MKTKYFNQTNLVDAGWTKGLIDKYLGQPDAYYENPHYSKAAPIKRYEETRVIETIQANNLSDALNKRVEKRKTTSAKRFTKKVQQLSETFVLEKGHEKKYLASLGMSYWQTLDISFYRDKPDQITVARNALRHNCSNYDYLLETVVKADPQLYDAFRKIVDEQIDKTYPHLKLKEKEIV